MRVFGHGESERTWNRTLLVLAVVACFAATASAETVYIEAEGFDDMGGWVVDTLAMDQIGSSYALAHGMGVAVKDAETTVTLPKAGTYRVWVRTRNWVAPWDVDGAPGRFKLLVNGKPLKTVFGSSGADWHWQDGGTVEIADKKTTLALRDLTGFDGRCDAILLTTDLNFTPPNEAEALAEFRRKALGLSDGPEDAGRFDLVVVGGGMAGTCAAISAARLGLQVALIQNRPVLGGNNSSEVRVHLQGRIHLPPYPRLGDVVDELDSGRQGNAKPAEYYGDAKKLRIVREQENLHLFLNTHAYKVEKREGRMAAVIARHTRTGKDLRFAGPLFVDCTGDGTIGFLAGADYRMGRESRAETGESLAPEKADDMTMGMSVQWYSVPTDEPSPFPECPWAVEFDEKSCQRVMMGEWDWETGMNRDQVVEAEQIRDYALRVVYGNWSFLKNHARDKAKYAKRRLGWVAYIGGKRESRRLLGDVILQQQDIEEQREFPDACVTTTWTIDLHYPAPENTKHFPGREFRSIAKHRKIKPYAIPYRCLYSRNVPNLFMAGRDISVTHVALGTVRVMRTTGMMGEVVGMAASLCVKKDTTPRGVYENHLDELKSLMQRGVGKAATVGKVKP